MTNDTPTEAFDAAFLSQLEGLRLMAKRLSGGSRAGGRRSRRMGDGLEFADHRAYVPGDDVRFVDWSYYARMDKLLRRLFHERSEAGVAILMDASSSMLASGGPGQATQGAGKFDYVRRVTAALAFVAMASLERVAVHPFAEALGQGMTTGRNAERIFDVLHFLRDLPATGRTDLTIAVKQWTERCPQPTTVIIVSDLLGCRDQLDGALARLQQHRSDVTVIHVYDSADASPALDGQAELVDAEGGGDLRVFVDAGMLAAYQERWQALLSDCRHSCLSRQAIYVNAPTDVPFERLVLHSLRQAGVLAG
ncbi:MAG: DUF58 domain-containing protein [Planctomycetota bacterium]